MSGDDFEIVAWKCDLKKPFKDEYREVVYLFNPEKVKDKYGEWKVKNVEPLVKLSDVKEGSG